MSSYLKIKQHAILSLQTLFRVSNKAFTLKGMWLLIFPSILTSPSAAISDTVHYENFIKNELKMEPTLSSLAFSLEENDKLKVSLV